MLRTHQWPWRRIQRPVLQQTTGSPLDKRKDKDINILMGDIKMQRCDQTTEATTTRKCWDNMPSERWTKTERNSPTSVDWTTLSSEMHLHPQQEDLQGHLGIAWPCHRKPNKPILHHQEVQMISSTSRRASEKGNRRSIRPPSDSVTARLKLKRTDSSDRQTAGRAKYNVNLLKVRTNNSGSVHSEPEEQITGTAGAYHRRQWCPRPLEKNERHLQFQSQKHARKCLGQRRNNTKTGSQ